MNGRIVTFLAILALTIVGSSADGEATPPSVPNAPNVPNVGNPNAPEETEGNPPEANTTKLVLGRESEGRLTCYVCGDWQSGIDCGADKAKWAEKSNCAQCSVAGFKVGEKQVISRLCSMTYSGSNDCTTPPPSSGAPGELKTCPCNVNLCNADASKLTAVSTAGFLQPHLAIIIVALILNTLSP